MKHDGLCNLTFYECSRLLFGSVNTARPVCLPIVWVILTGRWVAASLVVELILLLLATR